jgi:DNA-binding GntR family transcriptional regulator
VFDALLQRILSLDLPPGTKLSESDVAKSLDVSRQPVREAFKRLAAHGFLHIRPQRSTTVSFISETAVLKARFLRTALETHTCREACATLTPDDLAALGAIIDAQAAAIASDDKERFHALDDQFHQAICLRANVGYAWDLIHDSKAHMDRIRLLSLDNKSQNRALAEHILILEAIQRGDPDAAAHAMAAHLSQITVLIDEIKAKNHAWFTEETIAG